MYLLFLSFPKIESGQGMNSSDSQSALIIGIGNEFRGDDAAGRLVVNRLKEDDLQPGVETIEISGEGASLMESWTGYEMVILIDAVSTGGEAGRIYFFDAKSETIPAEFFSYSTHAFSVAEAVEMARALDRLPPQIWIYGIEGESFGVGKKVSDAVLKAVDEVAGRIRGILLLNSNEN